MLPVCTSPHSSPVKGRKFVTASSALCPRHPSTLAESALLRVIAGRIRWRVCRSPDLFSQRFRTPIFPNKSAEAFWPTSICSTLGSRHGLSPTPVKAIRASAIFSWSRTNKTATPTIAKSPNLRANSVNEHPAPGGVSGIDASNTISSLESACRQVGFEKIASRNLAFGCQVSNCDRAIQGEEHGGQLRRWIGVGQAAAQRAAIAYLLIADISQRLGEQRTAFSNESDHPADGIAAPGSRS